MPRPFLLDTNILISLLRQNELGERIDQAYGLSRNLGNQLVSVISFGEMHSLARQWKWGERKREQLGELLEQLICVDINNSDVIQAYGEIDDYLRRNGAPTGQNDLWIAATCHAANAVLLTTDKDFDPLHEQFIELIWIDPDTKNQPL